MGIFSGLKNKQTGSAVPVHISSGSTASVELYKNSVLGSVANCIGMHIGKLSPQVIRASETGVTVKDDTLSRLLTLRPCEELSAYDFRYKMASDYIYHSNAFAVLFYDRDFMRITSIRPVTVSNYEMLEDKGGNLFFRFLWEYDSKRYTLPYNHVIHIKGRFNRKRFFGTSPTGELQSTVDMYDTTNQGIKSAVKNATDLKGILKFNNFIEADELKAKVKEFQDAYMGVDNTGGIAGLDNAFEFVPLNAAPLDIPTEQMAYFRDEIYSYYNINRNIIASEYNEEEWNAFFEAVVEPIAIQLSQEFTYKVFTERERGFGNKIVFTTDRLQYAALSTRLNMGEKLFDRGVITINELRTLLYLPTIENGDDRMISLNYVNADNQDLYQVGRERGGGDG